MNHLLRDYISFPVTFVAALVAEPPWRMAKARAELVAVGLSLGQEQEGDFGKIAHIDDPAGNHITLAESPDRSHS